MAIYFRDRKYGNTFDATYTLWDGKVGVPDAIADPSKWLVGDEVNVMYTVPLEQAEPASDVVLLQHSQRLAQLPHKARRQL